MFANGRRTLSFGLTLAAMAVPAFAQEVPQEGPVATTALVSARSKSPDPLNSAALKLEVNGHATAINAVVPVRTEGVQVAILIDDGLRGRFGTQLNEVKQFIRSLPANTQVLVGYMQNGMIRHQGGFSTDLNAAAEQVRLPLSVPGISGSPYFSLSDFVKHWPGEGNVARTVLMITNGVDLYNGSVSPLNQYSPYVIAAQNDAERAGVAVYSIYYPDTAIRGGLASFSGQSYLQQVAEATGGESFYEGTITPPSLTPYLDEFRSALSESYLISFEANASHERRNTLVNIRLKTEQAGMKLNVPQAVHPGGAEQAAAE